MDIFDELLEGLENSKLISYENGGADALEPVYYDELENSDREGVIKACFHENGRLKQVYSRHENHVGVISSTRLGKTTSYVIPTVLSFAKQKTKRSMIISDPKGEIYRHTAQTLRDNGYCVKLLNFRDFLHSECYNILTPVFYKYRDYLHIEKEAVYTERDGSPGALFRGVIFHDEAAFETAVKDAKFLALADIGNDIDNIAAMFIDVKKQTDPYWEEAARDVLKAFIWAMLEDSEPDKAKVPITVDTFSFSTIMRIISMFNDDDRSSNYDDKGYFTNRSNDSEAYRLAKNTLIENAKSTRKCVLSELFNESTVRLLTSCTSFELGDFIDCPTVLFIDYRDELKVHFGLISIFVQDAYRYLIEQANSKPDGKLEIPFYFILDEFGNFAKMRDFETTISACAGRNIFFMLVMQSYAQLNSVYGDDIATIIRDNLNVHVFFGSNNPSTIDEFSRECGLKSRISPLSALNGRGTEIDGYQIETVPLVPKSKLTQLEPGECIVTEANCGYVMFSKLERFFECDEFKDLPLSKESEYECEVKPFDPRYIYRPPEKW